MASLFISYRHEHRELVKALHDEIESLGHEAWFDEKQFGEQPWWDAILEQIRRCDAFLPVYGSSSAYDHSYICMLELEYAHELGKPIIPVALPDTNIDALAPEISDKYNFLHYDAGKYDVIVSMSRRLSSVHSPHEIGQPIQPPSYPISAVRELWEVIRSAEDLDKNQQYELAVKLRDLSRHSDTNTVAQRLIALMLARGDLLNNIAIQLGELSEAGGLDHAVKPLPVSGEDNPAVLPNDISGNSTQSELPHHAQAEIHTQSINDDTDIPEHVTSPKATTPTRREQARRKLQRWIAATVAGLGLLGAAAESSHWQNGVTTRDGSPHEYSWMALNTMRVRLWLNKPDLPNRISLPLVNSSRVSLPLKNSSPCFMMGTDPKLDAQAEPDEQPIHEVCLKPFTISTTEITFQQYDFFALATDRPLPPDEGWGRQSRPVINVNWHDASDYALWLSDRVHETSCSLPTEAEWEYAARGGTTTRYFWGDDIKQADRYANFGSNAHRTLPVANLFGNDYGLYDTAGNVWEWVQDIYATSYSGAPTDGSARGGDKDEWRVLRGGSWSGSVHHLRSSDRFRFLPDVRYLNLGFRVVCRPHR